MSDIYELGNVPIFRNIPLTMLAPVLASAQRQIFHGGEAIFRQGDIPRYLYIVEEGMVDIVLPAVADDIILATFEAGSFFGELGVFDHQPRTATARASMETSLICVPLDVLSELLETHLPAARQFMTVIIERLRRADELLSRVQIRNINEVIDEKMSVGEHVADMVARFGGSWTFITSFAVFLVIWMIVNTTWLLASPPDPFPFIFLNLILSCIAALQAPVIMMSQNRQAAKDRIQADQEYQVNVKAEFAIQQLHRKLDEMRSTLIQHRHAEVEQRWKAERV